uniref:Uncharacterized protein n=1 Tax=Babesia bovis TaxID=5865 RepID=S6B6E1_BABBO|nr:hypothetical protein [Babesia bovis]
MYKVNPDEILTRPTQNEVLPLPLPPVISAMPELRQRSLKRNEESGVRFNSGSTEKTSTVESQLFLLFIKGK